MLYKRPGASSNKSSKNEEMMPKKCESEKQATSNDK